MIYFIQDSRTFHVKIGYTGGEPGDRLGALQTGNPGELKLLATIEGTQSEEAALHRRFSPDRVAGEWFSPSPDLLAFILAKKETQREPREDVPFGAPVPVGIAAWRVVASESNDNSGGEVSFCVLTESETELPDPHAAIDAISSGRYSLYSVTSITQVSEIVPATFHYDEAHDQRCQPGQVIDLRSVPNLEPADEDWFVTEGAAL